MSVVTSASLENAPLVDCGFNRVVVDVTELDTTRYTHNHNNNTKRNRVKIKFSIIYYIYLAIPYAMFQYPGVFLTTEFYAY